MTYTEVKTKACSVRIYASGTVSYKPRHARRWIHLTEGRRIGRRRRRARVIKLAKAASDAARRTFTKVVN